MATLTKFCPFGLPLQGGIILNWEICVNSHLKNLGEVPCQSLSQDAFMLDFVGSAPTLGLTPVHLTGEVYLQELSSMLPAAVPWHEFCMFFASFIDIDTFFSTTSLDIIRLCDTFFQINRHILFCPTPFRCSMQFCLRKCQ